MDDDKNKIKLNLEISEEAAGAQPVQEVVPEVEVIDQRERMGTLAIYAGKISNHVAHANMKRAEIVPTDNPTMRILTGDVEDDPVIEWPLYDPSNKNKKLTIANFQQLQQYADFLAMLAFEGKTGRLTYMPSRYASWRALSANSRGDTRANLIKMSRLLKLAEISFTVWEDGIKKRQRRSILTEIPDPELNKKGPLTVEFDPVYLNVAMQKGGKSGNKNGPLLIAPWAGKIPTSTHPDAYSIMRKIFELKQFNAGRNKHENVISVKTLLKECGSRATLEEILALNDQDKRIGYRGKIREPFETDLSIACGQETEANQLRKKDGKKDHKIVMEAQPDRINYEYWDANGPVSAERLESMPIKDWAALNIHFEWPAMPELFERRKANKIKQIEEYESQTEIEKEAAHQIKVKKEVRKQEKKASEARKKKEAAGDE